MKTTFEVSDERYRNEGRGRVLAHNSMSAHRVVLVRVNPFQFTTALAQWCTVMSAMNPAIRVSRKQRRDFLRSLRRRGRGWTR